MKIHKRFNVKYPFVSTWCHHKLKKRFTSYYWKDVTCKNCLKHRPKKVGEGK